MCKSCDARIARAGARLAAFVVVKAPYDSSGIVFPMSHGRTRLGHTLALQRRKHRRRHWPMPPRRAFLLGGAAMVVGGAAVIGAVGRMASPELEGMPAPVRPPTADHDDDVFRRLCVRCGMCGVVCENGCIRFFGSDEPRMGAMTPYLDVRRRSCTLCMRCTQICPSGALRPVEDDLETIAATIDMGRARVERDLCLSYLGRICGYCHDACPLPGTAIRLTPPGLPVIEDGCVGCGRCVEHCPQEPSALTLVPASVREHT